MSFDIGRVVKPCGHDVFGVNYIEGGCPRCHDLNQYYDFEWDPHTGDLMVVEGADLLENLALKAISTSRESSMFHLEYGTRLKESIGFAVQDVYLESLAETELLRALGGILQRQKQQLSAGQSMDGNELISKVTSVETRFVEPRNLALRFRIITKAGYEQEVVLWQ